MFEIAWVYLRRKFALRKLKSNSNRNFLHYWFCLFWDKPLLFVFQGCPELEVTSLTWLTLKREEPAETVEVLPARAKRRCSWKRSTTSNSSKREKGRSGNLRWLFLKHQTLLSYACISFFAKNRKHTTSSNFIKET